MAEEFTITGQVALRAKRWEVEDPRWVALLCHGYGEHIDRYDHVAARLNSAGAAVYGLDHMGHGRSEGERVLCTDFESMIDDFHLLADSAHVAHPGLPQVLIGHSMGGMLAARYVQRHGDELAAAVLSAPLLGGGFVHALLGMDTIPDTPLDPGSLSRDASVGEEYAADPLVHHGPFKRATLEGLAAFLEAIRSGGRFAIPVLWLHGTGDPIVSFPETGSVWDELRAADSESRSYPGAKHEIFNETNKDEVLDDLVGWVGEKLG